MSKATQIKLNIGRILLWFWAGLLCIGLGIGVFHRGMLPAVALEQELRCGIAEHVHTDECYQGDFLQCEKTAHSHNENCYIVLLEDNNIDGVFGMMEEGQSLEGVIDSTVSGALIFNKDLNAPTAEGGMEQQTVAALNATIAEEETLPDIVLNEELNNLSTVQQDQPQTEGFIELEQSNPLLSGSAATYAVGSEPDTTANKANIYVYIDGSWQCIGTLPFTTSSSSSGTNNRYDGYVQTADLLQMVNQSLGTSYTAGNFGIVSSTSRTTGYSGSSLNIGATTARIFYNARSNARTSTRYVRLVPAGYTSSTTSFGFYSVTLEYPEGYVDTHYVRTNSTFTFPAENYEWSNAAGTQTYQAGESVTVRSKSTYYGTKLGPITEVTVHYDVNFPTLNSATVSTKPTLAGTAVTTLSDLYSEGASATLHNISQQTVAGQVNNNNTGLSRVAQFKGWRIEGTDIILAANTTLVWEELLQYQTKGTISLEGVWDHGEKVTASFFVRFDSVAVDSGGNVTGQDSNKYTKEIFVTYVGGLDTSMSVSALHTLHYIDGESAENSYAVDKEIRNLYGGVGRNGAWLASFPGDEFVFQELVQYAETGYLSVEGEPVAVERLNAQNYAIRWYVFKAQDDAWHIDGRLVKKTGSLLIEKTFNGNTALLEQAKENFYIDALNERTGETTRLTLDQATLVGNAYQWKLDDILYNERWTLTESVGLDHVEGAGVKFDVYSEYTIIDPLGDQSRSGEGTSLSVLGRTMAVDEGDEMILRTQFNNIYHRSNSIIIKKQDHRTGAALGGAEFSLLQQGQPLKFTYNAEDDSYEYDPVNGTQTVLSGRESGYFEILIEDFSYDNGAVTVREVTAPAGYTSVAAIEIGYTDDQGNIGILAGENEMIRFENGVLLIGNSTDTVTVTAEKRWECPAAEWQPVQVQLMANGKIASAIIGMSNARVTLSEENGWTHQWQDLPLYANGQKITWSLVELAIGGEAAKTDGSFVNWLASYDPPIITTDEQGQTNVRLVVTNTTKRVMLRLTKTNVSRTLHLPNAVFYLEAVDADGNLLENEVAKTGTTDATGVHIFDNMKVGVRYRLTELSAPEGYRVAPMPIYCTIGEDGFVQVEEHMLAEFGSTAYNIIVRNAEDVPLPESGGGGDLWYFAVGLLMMAASGLYISISQKKGRWKKGI